MVRPRTKLVCTIGPASVDRVRDLVDVGMSVARVNFSHGSPDEQKAAVHAVRAAAHHARRSVAVMVDLPGPKLRLGELPGGELQLEAGTTFQLRTNRPALAQEVRPGDRILLADGAVELLVLGLPATEAPATEAPATTADEPVVEAEPAVEQEPMAAAAAPDTAGHLLETAAVATEVVRGGLIRSRAGVNIPTERLIGDAMTAEDLAAIPRLLDLRADVVAQSFVRSADDVRALRQLLPTPGPLVVAKIETRAAVADFEAILEVADGVMIARGDLGADIPYEEVPLVQKDLLRRALARGRFTVVATQMLESMSHARRPTRAEASDVANAVLDGADAVMLSAETAIGAYPVEAAQAMIDICLATERGATPPTDGRASTPVTITGRPEAICRAAVDLAAAHGPTTAIWSFTRTGRTAELLSLQRPRVPIVAFTVSAIAARRVAARNGVIPVVLQAGRKGESLIDQMKSAARVHGLLNDGEPAVIVLVTTSSQPAGINRLELHTVD